MGSTGRQASPRQGFPLRLDPALAGAVASLAAQELRSANAQIECMLRSRLARTKPGPAVSLLERGADRKAIALRLPEDLLARLAEQAQAAGRSTNAHIETCLLEEFGFRGLKPR